MMKFFALLSLFFVTIYAVVPSSIVVHNNVAPCAGGSYASTVKLFYTNYGQANVNQGLTVTVSSGQIDPNNGLGIQENGEYCRNGGAVSGCLNPDNAGMQIVYTGNSCTAIQENAPFYCGSNPPDARNIIAVSGSGGWPNCVVTLTRKSNAPGCQYSC